jgi:hypothetical protein
VVKGASLPCWRRWFGAIGLLRCDGFAKVGYMAMWSRDADAGALDDGGTSRWWPSVSYAAGAVQWDRVVALLVFWVAFWCCVGANVVNPAGSSSGNAEVILVATMWRRLWIWLEVRLPVCVLLGSMGYVTARSCSIMARVWLWCRVV